MSLLSDAMYNFRHAYNYAYDKGDLSHEGAIEYATFYLQEYPDGDIGHGTAFWRRDKETHPNRKMELERGRRENDD